MEEELKGPLRSRPPWRVGGASVCAMVDTFPTSATGPEYFACIKVVSRPRQKRTFAFWVTFSSRCEGSKRKKMLRSTLLPPLFLDS